jgi:ABC-type sugar transport system permease subunit
MLTDKLVQKSFTVTGLFFILKVPLLMATGLGLAILVRDAWRGVGGLRTIILLPTVTSMVVVTTVWGFMYHPTSGLLNSMLTSVGLPAQDFLTSPTQALPSIVAITIWKDVGLVMLFYLAGLMGIPNTLYEAARIDGANGWQQFRHITFPSLRGTHIFVLVTSTVAAFKVFVPVFMTTQGGPLNSTKVILVSIYDYAFRFNQMGYAAAISVILALILVVISVIQFFVTRERKPPKQKTAYSSKKVSYL